MRDPGCGHRAFDVNLQGEEGGPRGRAKAERIARYGAMRFEEYAGEWIGHKTIEITFKIYWHLMPGSISKAAKILNLDVGT